MNDQQNNPPPDFINAYDMIDRFLRNNLNSDEDYAEYSAALESLIQPQTREPLTDEVIAALWSWSQSTQAESIANTQQHAFARAIEAAHGIGEKK